MFRTIDSAACVTNRAMMRCASLTGGFMTDDTAIRTRQREIATEHLLFKLMEYVEARHPGLLDEMERSIDHLGDPAGDGSKDDDAVRAIARRMIAGARTQSRA
jgi:hypothetical protein